MNEFIRRFFEDPAFFNDVAMTVVCLFLFLWMTRRLW